MADVLPRRRVIKKVSGGHGHHGGAWKVAYADFVTAMMALFMVMWLLSSTDQASRKEIAQYFRTGILPSGDMAMDHAAQIAPSVMEVAPVPPPPGEASLDAQQASALTTKLQAMAAIDQELASLLKNVSVRDTPAGILIDIVDDGANDLLFETSSSTLKPALIKFLSLLAPMLGDQANRIEINGHTDARPFVAGSSSNWNLSFERANQARQILEGNGVRVGQISGVVGRGASEPYVPSDPYAARNRRLSVLLVSDDAKAASRARGAQTAAPAAHSETLTLPGAKDRWPHGTTFKIGESRQD